MLESLLSIGSFCWSGHAYHTTCEAIAMRVSLGARLQGRFACASSGSDGDVTLARDRLGLNKLFLAVHESGTVVVANYACDLIGHGVPFEAIHSVPAGYVVRIAPREDLVEISRYGDPRDRAGSAPVPVDDVAWGIRVELEVWFSRLARQFGGRRICICLSGGLDSALIAALARKYFSDVTAYTYSFTGRGTAVSEAAMRAERLALTLQIPFRLVPAAKDDLNAALDAALCYGQDWRDFNVHCAIVNEVVARAIRRDARMAGGAPPLVLTGDLANEFLADYDPVPYDGEEYYGVSRMKPSDLRRILIRGLDSGDREVGIFSRHGLEVLQLYGLIVNQYHRLPRAFIGRKRAKRTLVRKIAGDLLPAFLFNRPKVRARVGDSTAYTGILPLLMPRGHGSDWLRRAFCRLFHIEHPVFLDRFIRGGCYRCVRPFSDPRRVINGYIAG
jgi:asparagine synthetase B (glutamine-hydrolysing)